MRRRKSSSSSLVEVVVERFDEWHLATVESLNEKFRPMEGDLPSKLDIVISGSVIFFKRFFGLVRKHDKKKEKSDALLEDETLTNRRG